MKIRILNVSALRSLKQDINRNLNKYKGDSRDWLNDFFADKRNTQLSPIDDPQIDLSIQKEDYENARLLYEGYPSITPAMASDERLWASLCHNQHYDYMHARWPVEIKRKDQTEIGLVTQRYFFYTGLKKSQERNGLSRLWLSAAYTHDERRADEYELTKVFLQNTNFIFHMFGRDCGSSKNIIRGTMDAINRIQQETGVTVVSTPVKELFRTFNLMGGASMLDMLSEEEVKDFAYSFILNARAEKDKNSKVLASIT